MKRRKFNSRDTSTSYSSGEDDTMAQLRETFHITGRKSKEVQNVDISSKAGSRPQSMWF